MDSSGTKEVGVIWMVHLVCCDNAGKSDERVLNNINDGVKTMILLVVRAIDI